MGLGPAPVGFKEGEPHSPSVLLLDLDDTLYRNHAIPERVRAAIQSYMREVLKIPEDKVPDMNLEMYLKYGTTMAGLVASGYKIDYDHWHSQIHHEALDYDALIAPDPQLRDLLFSIDLPKYVFTNADRVHAETCLERLGISDCFKGIYDFEWAMEMGKKKGLLTEANPVMCKPNHKIFHMVLEDIGCQAHEAMFFDDSARNILAAHEVGIATVMVGRQGPVPGADVCIMDMHELPKVVPELVDQPGLVHASHGHAVQSAAPLEGALKEVLQKV